jgi:hypothetical protein
MSKREAAADARKRLTEKYGADPAEILGRMYATIICARCGCFEGAHIKRDGWHEFIPQPPHRYSPGSACSETHLEAEIPSDG